MIQLTGDDIQKAWDDYREYLISLGGDFSQDNAGRRIWLRELERAFKFAYAAGKLAK